MKSKILAVIFLSLTTITFVSGETKQVTPRSVSDDKVSGIYSLSRDDKLVIENDRIFVSSGSTVFKLNDREFVDKIVICEQSESALIKIEKTRDIGSDYVGLLYFLKSQTPNDGYLFKWLLPVQPTPTTGWFFVSDIKLDSSKRLPSLDIRLHMLQQTGEFNSRWVSVNLDDLGNDRFLTD